jgi:hypothetical protein
MQLINQVLSREVGMDSHDSQRTNVSDDMNMMRSTSNDQVLF